MDYVIERSQVPGHLWNQYRWNTHQTQFTVAYRSGGEFKSDHLAMDKNAHSSLNTEEHKSITFDLTSATIAQTKIQCTGNLTIARVTKELGDVEYKVRPDDGLLCTGSKKINMSDFEVDPPTFMFGTVKTGDEITVKFSISLTAVRK